jgi:hypothetical protein
MKGEGALGLHLASEYSLKPFVEKKLRRNANLSYKVYLGPHVRLKIRVCLDSSPTKNEQNAEKVPKSCDLGTFLWRRRRDLNFLSDAKRHAEFYGILSNFPCQIKTF